MTQYGIAVNNMFGFLDEDETGDVSEQQIVTVTSKAEKEAKKKAEKKLQQQQRKQQAKEPTATLPPSAALSLTTPVSATTKGKSPAMAKEATKQPHPGDGGRKDGAEKENRPTTGRGRGGRGVQRVGGDEHPQRRGGMRGSGLPPRFGGGIGTELDGAEQQPLHISRGGARGGGGGGRTRGVFRGGRGGVTRGRGGLGAVTEGGELGGFADALTTAGAGGGIGTFGEEESERASGARFPRGGNSFGGARARGFRSGGGGLAPRGGRGGGRGRQFERQSGSDKTGVKSVEKRDGAGAYNWGTQSDELARGETEPLNVTITSDAGAEQLAPTATTESAASPDDSDADKMAPAVHELTLEEWKAAQQEQKRKPFAFNIRKPGEGEDASVWTKLQPLQRDAASAGADAKARKQHEHDEEVDARGRKDLTAQIRIELSTDNLPQHTRGGAFGGPRGRGVRGGGGGPSPQRGARGGGGGSRGGRRGDVPLMDDASFPQLAPTATAHSPLGATAAS